MAYKFQVGAARLSGSTTFEDSLVANQSFSAQSLSASAGLEIGGTVRLDGVADAVAADADKLLFRDSDNLIKAESVSDLRDLYFADVSGDATIAAGGALTIANDAVEQAMIADDAVGADQLASDAVVEASIVDNAVTLAKMAGITRGSLIVGDASGDPSYLAKGTAAQFLQSDGSDPVYVSVSGQATVASGGALSLAAAAITGQTEMTGDVADADELMISDDGTLKRLDFSVLRDAVFNDVSGDATVAAGGALTIAADAVEDSMLNDNVATGLAGNGLTATSGVLAVVNATNGGLFVDSDAISLNLNDLASGDVAVAADSIAIYDADASGTRKESIADLMTAVAGDGLVASSGVLAVQVSGALKITSDKLGISGSFAGDGIKYAGGVDSILGITLDLNDLPTATVNVAADSIAIVDADGSNDTKKESIADLMAAVAGAGLSATSGVLSVDGNSVTPKDFSGAVSLASGYNVPDANAMGGAIIATLPAPTEVGYMVAVKAPSSCSDTNTVTIQGGTMDGQTSLVLESPGAAVTLICIDTDGDSWIVM